MIIIYTCVRHSFNSFVILFLIFLYAVGIYSIASFIIILPSFEPGALLPRSIAVAMSRPVPVCCLLFLLFLRPNLLILVFTVQFFEHTFSQFLPESVLEHVYCLFHILHKIRSRLVAVHASEFPQNFTTYCSCS